LGQPNGILEVMDDSQHNLQDPDGAGDKSRKHLEQEPKRTNGGRYVLVIAAGLSLLATAAGLWVSKFPSVLCQYVHCKNIAPTF
jgi:hypothetical protein